MSYLSIGEFAQRTRLSPKALRIYDQLGLIEPAAVERGSGYRRYREDQVEKARLVGLLRRLDMPLAVIGSVLALDGPEAAAALDEWWSGVATAHAERQALVGYLRAHLRREDTAVYDVETHSMPERAVLSINRHVHIGETDQFFTEAFARLRAAGPGLPGIAGVPFLVFYGDVSEDSDGPIELCRPVSDVDSSQHADGRPDAELQRRVEPAHEEAFSRLAMKDMGWPAMLPAYDALERWVTGQRRIAAGPVRQLLIADQRTASPDTLVCHLSLPLR